MKIDKKIIFPSILILIASVLVVTFAYFGAEIITSGVTPTGVTTGKVNVTISDTKVNVDNLKPIYDENYLSQAYKKEFTITNNDDSLNACTKIKLNITSISDSLKSKHLKFKIVSNDSKENEGNFENANANESLLLLESGFFETNTEKSYTLYIWISYSEEENQIDMLGTSLTAKLQVEATDTKEKSSCESLSLVEQIQTDNEVQSDASINFGTLSSDTNGQGLYRTSDLTKTEDINADGTGEEVLYFRGAVENNYVVFADFCWRIVRTNEDGSIKLRYGGEPDSSGYCPQTGTDVKINNTDYAFNTTYNAAKYVGYMYDTNTSSTAKTAIDTWYESNIVNKGEDVTSLIEDTPYCNDTSVSSTSGNLTYYGAYGRLTQTTKAPQYKCPQVIDKYTVNTDNGNGKLTYPIALLTADEVAYAGGVYATNNTSFYLYTGSGYWTISPCYFNSSNANQFPVDSAGSFGSYLVSNTYGLAPAISLTSKAAVAGGTGLYNDPYIIG